VDFEHLKHGLSIILYLIESASRRAEQHQAGFVLKSVAQYPSVVAVYLFSENHIEIFYHQKYALILFIRKIHQLRQSTLPQPYLILFKLQFPIDSPPLLRFSLFSQMEQRFKPEFSGRTDLVAVFAEDDGEPPFFKLGIAPDFRDGAEHQHRLADTSWADNENMLIGAACIVTYGFKRKFQLGMTDYKVTD
jgi:hypothetical protein